MTFIEDTLTVRMETGVPDAMPGYVAPGQQAQGVSEGGGESQSIPERFKILCQIGVGGMGIVYKVRDRETGEMLGLKLLKPEIASDPRMREELRKEVCLARKVTHKNVCRIHEFYRSGGASCISMEFVDGETLLSRLRRVGALSIPDSIEITRQICAGLHEAHVRGIVHRDLKPANIMIDEAGVVKIMDFGIARLSQENGQATRTLVGTPEYMAPEQLELKAMGPRTDIYALGLLLYEMITGSQAFAGDSAIAVALKQIRESPRRPSEIVGTLSPALEAVILKCLRKNSDSRFQSIEQLDQALQKAALSAPPVPIVTRFGIDVAAQYTSAKLRDLGPQLAQLGPGLRRAIVRTSEAVNNQSKRLAVLAASRGAMNPGKNRRIQIAAVVTATFLAVVLFGVFAVKYGNRGPMTSEAMAAPPVQNSQPAVSVQTPVATPVALVTPGEPVVDASQQNLATHAVDQGSTGPSTGAASSVVPTAASTPQPDVPVAAPVKKQARTRPILAPLPLKPAPSTANTKASVFVGPSQPSPTDQAPAVTGAAVVSASAPASQPVTPAAASADPAKPGPAKPDAIAASYLEVGTFKESEWADDAVDKLSQLGFHAICVHKTLLWKQSYHVEVGPYATPEEISHAEEQLTAQGFKPHVVK
jgi:Protein kinase domain/SPOR domain